MSEQPQQPTRAPLKDGMVDGGDFSVRFGVPEQWKAFARRNPEFMKGQRELLDALNAVFIRDVAGITGADGAIYALGRLCVEDFLEIQLLCGNGYGFAAMKVIRGMFERLSTAKFLRLHPERTNDYLDYYWVSEHKLIQAVQRTMKPGLIDPERKREVDERFAQVRPRYLIPDCDTCGTVRLNHTWTRVDTVSMAEKVGLRDLIVACWYFPTHHIHATVHGILARTKGNETGGLTFDGTSQPDEVDRAMLTAHALILYVLELQKDHFALTWFEPAYKKLEEGFRTSWTDRVIPHAPHAPGDDQHR